LVGRFYLRPQQSNGVGLGTVCFHHVDCRTAVVRSVALKDDELTIGREGWILVVKAAEVVESVMRQVVDWSASIRVDNRDLFRPRITEMCERHQLGPVR